MASRYVELVFRHWIRFAILLLVLPAAVTAASLTLLRTYQASAALWVENPTYFGAAAAAAGWNQYQTPAQNQADILSQILQTRDFRDKLGDALATSGTVSDPLARDQLLRSLPRPITVSATGSRLMTVSFSCRQPAFCLAVVSSTVDLYRDRLGQLQKQQAELASTYLTNQLQDAQKTLSASQDALQKYLRAHPRVTLADALNVPELDLLVRQSDRDRAQVTALEQRLSEVQLISLGTAGALTSISTVVDPPRLVPPGPITSGSIQRALLVWFACLAAGGVYLMVLALIERAPRDPRELERRFGVPVVGTIPRLAGME